MVKVFLELAGIWLPSAQNNPHATMAYFGVAYSVPLQDTFAKLLSLPTNTVKKKWQCCISRELHHQKLEEECIFYPTLTDENE